MSTRNPVAAGAPSAVTGSRHSIALAAGGAVIDHRSERDLDARRTKSAARSLVANLVAERLAQTQQPTSAPPTGAHPTAPSEAVPATPQTPRNGVANSPHAVPKPASLPSAYASSRRSTKNFLNSTVDAAAASVATSTARSSPRGSPRAASPPPPSSVLHQPVWRHAGTSTAPTKPTATAAADATSSKPRSWLTRDELAEQVEAAKRRASAAEDAAEGARLAAELLRDELAAAEAREVEASNAAALARTQALTVGDNEVRLRCALDEQASHLATAIAEESAARENARKACAATVDVEARLEASEARGVKLTQRADKAERQLREAREALAAARATQAEVDELRRELVAAKEAAATFRAQAADEATAKRTLGAQARESRAALARLREEAQAHQKESESAAARDAQLFTSRLSALRHVNGVLEAKLRTVFDARLKESSKATTLQEAVQMLTDEYVVVVDQLRAAQASLSAEQVKVAQLERAHTAMGAEVRDAVERRREAEAKLVAALAEVSEVDTTLVPRLSQDAVAVSHMQVRLAEVQRHDAQHVADAAQRVQVAEIGQARAQEAAAAHEEELNLLRRRLNQALKRNRDLQSIIDESSSRRWVPPAAPPERIAGRDGGGTLSIRSAPASPAAVPPAAGRVSSSRMLGAGAQQVAVSEAFAEGEGYYEDALLLAATGSPRPTVTSADVAPSPRNRAPVAFVA